METIPDQKKHFTAQWQENGTKYKLVAEVRHDDNCRNGHNTFSITGDLYENGRWMAGGCLHDEIAEHIPELAPFTKWHLCSTDGPMHYPSNVLYFAGDRDCCGKRKGEVKQTTLQIRFGDNPIMHTFRGDFVKFLREYGPSSGYDFEVIRYDHTDTKGYRFQPKFTFGGYADAWHNCPFDTESEARDFLYALQHCNPVFVEIATAWGEGKEPELENARTAAIWPDATLEQLQDKSALDARLPNLLDEFRAAVESLGLRYE